MYYGDYNFGQFQREVGSLISHISETVHYGLTGGWVQKFKGSYLLCFLHSALVFKARGQCGHHAFPLA